MSNVAVSWAKKHNLPVHQYALLHELADASDRYGRGSLSLLYLSEEAGLSLKKVIELLLDLSEKQIVGFDPLIALSNSDLKKRIAYGLLLQRHGGA